MQNIQTQFSAIYAIRGRVSTLNEQTETLKEKATLEDMPFETLMHIENRRSSFPKYTKLDQDGQGAVQLVFTENDAVNMQSDSVKNTLKFWKDSEAELQELYKETNKTRNEESTLQSKKYALERRIRYSDTTFNWIGFFDDGGGKTATKIEYLADRIKWGLVKLGLKEAPALSDEETTQLASLRDKLKTLESERKELLDNQEMKLKPFFNDIKEKVSGYLDATVVSDRLENDWFDVKTGNFE